MVSLVMVLRLFFYVDDGDDENYFYLFLFIHWDQYWVLKNRKINDPRFPPCYLHWYIFSWVGPNVVLFSDNRNPPPPKPPPPHTHIYTTNTLIKSEGDDDCD